MSSLPLWIIGYAGQPRFNGRRLQEGNVDYFGGFGERKEGYAYLETVYHNSVIG